MTGFERHLLCGDEPTLREVAAELSQASVDAMSGRAESDKIGENHQIEASNTVESSKYRENYKSGYITDELREWMDLVLTADDQAWAIADRIDEQFDRCCELWERVAQDAIHAQLKAEQERDELKKKLDEYEHADTAESIVRDIHLGKVTDTQAVERIRALP